MLKAQHGSVKDQRNLSFLSGSCSLSSLKPLSSPHWTHSLFESRSSYATHAYLDLLVHPKFDSNCPTSQLGLQAWVIVRGSVTGSLSSFVLTFQQLFFFWLIYYLSFLNTLPSLCFQRVMKKMEIPLSITTWSIFPSYWLTWECVGDGVPSHPSLYLP